MPVTVAALAVAPVKGMRLMAADTLEIGPSGAVGDRSFVVLEDDHRLVSTSRTPALLEVVASLGPSGVLGLRFPGGDQVAALPQLGEPVTTKLYHGRVLAGRLAVADPLWRALSAHLGRPVRLMALDPGQTGADDFPVSLMSSASLAAVGTELEGGAPDARRFRMNVTLDGLAAWEEHGWSGREVALGEEVRVRIRSGVRCHAAW